MAINMGTPAHPEGIPHFFTKELIGKRITSAHEVAASPRQRHYYGSPPDRTWMTFAQAVPSAAVQWSDTRPYWYVWFDEQPHDECEGGITVCDLVREMGKNGEVRVESDWLDFRPDIGIYREGEFNPAAVLEVVDTAQSSQKKLRAFKTEGIAAYKVDVKGMVTPRTTLNYNPMFVEPLANSRCGREQRDTVGRVVDYWGSLADQGLHLPWIGCCFYPSGVKEYMYGSTSIADDESWSFGDKEIKGIQRDESDWGAPNMIASAGPSRTLSKTQWRDTIAYLRVAAGCLGAQGKLKDPFMKAIAKYGGEVMSYAYP